MSISPVTDLHETAHTSSSVSLAWTAATAPVESPEGTTVQHPTDPPIIDRNGDAWALTATGHITVNGNIDSRTGSSDVLLLYYHNHDVYQQNLQSTWYETPGGTSPWVPAAGPLTTHLTVISELVTLKTIFSSKTSAVTLINQIIKDVGALSP